MYIKETVRCTDKCRKEEMKQRVSERMTALLNESMHLHTDIYTLTYILHERKRWRWRSSERILIILIN